MAEKSWLIYHCPHCRLLITIIGDPASRQELLSRYLAKRPLCHQCLKPLG